MIKVKAAGLMGSANVCSHNGRNPLTAMFACDETVLGHYIKVSAPNDFKFMLMVAESMCMSMPNADIIENVAYSSQNPFFKSTRFWNALRSYRRKGFRHVRKKETLSAKTELTLLKFRRNFELSDKNGI